MTLFELFSVLGAVAGLCFRAKFGLQYGIDGAMLGGILGVPLGFLLGLVMVFPTLLLGDLLIRIKR
ncbi:MAG: hypothetical protein ICV55_10010 [Coleofasciculus sp. C3-bin4]|nr:hypothetical protein [Coleofasciculus sp. C3-bin4]